MKARKTWSLEELSKGKSIFLLDTCVIIEPIFFDLDGKSLEEKANHFGKNNKFLQELHKSLTSKKFYITELVLEELENGAGYSPKKNSKKRRGTPRETPQALLELRRNKIKEKEIRRKIVGDFTFNDRIYRLISPAQLLLYGHFYVKYEYFKKKYGLSETDFDLLVCSASSFLNRRKTILITNDKGIGASWRELINLERFLPYRLPLFYRAGYNEFKKVG